MYQSLQGNEFFGSDSDLFRRFSSAPSSCRPEATLTYEETEKRFALNYTASRQWVLPRTIPRLGDWDVREKFAEPPALTGDLFAKYDWN
jgi:hypothetical protein